MKVSRTKELVTQETPYLTNTEQKNLKNWKIIQKKFQETTVGTKKRL